MNRLAILLPSFSLPFRSRDNVMGLETMEFGRIYTERFCVSDDRLGRLPSGLTHFPSNRVSQHTLLSWAGGLAQA
jgi:hypothetical protein